MNGADSKVTTECALGRVMVERTTTIIDRIDRHEEGQAKEMKDVWDTINGLRNRLPNWAVFTISVLMGICGWLARMALH